MSSKNERPHLVYRLTPDLVYKLEIVRLRLCIPTRDLTLDFLINSAFEQLFCGEGGDAR